MKEYKKYYSSPVGLLEISGNDEAITGLHYVKKEGVSDSLLPSPIKKCIQQLDEYFAGKRKIFDLPLSFQGSDFQKRVWKKLENIPYGKTISYGGIAQLIKKPMASRAVGMANNRNNISIVIPCHRVIGSDGSMTGYASGIWRKEWLLEHEQNNS